MVKFPKKIIFLICLGGGIWLIINYLNQKWYEGLIPKKIEISGAAHIYNESHFREGCGVDIFYLSKNTLDAIKRDGLLFFKDALQARSHDDYYHRYQPWQETPIPPSWTSEGSWILCFGGNEDFHHKIIEAAKVEGAFYTTKPEGELVVIPSLGIIIFSYFG
jgi:hypothetical protein